MELWYQRGLVALFAALTFSTAAAMEDSDDGGLIPPLERRVVKLSGIDTENFQIGLSGGLLAIEDFETGSLVVASATYHVTEDFFVEGRYGTSTAGESSFERLSGAASLLTDDDRELAFYSLSLGVNLFPGEAFVLDRWAVSSSFFLIGGVGATDFAGNQAFTVNGGAGYRLVANDFLSFDFMVRDHLFDTEITGDTKTTHNLEVSFGLSVFF